jgi:plastocyanin
VAKEKCMKISGGSALLTLVPALMLAGIAPATAAVYTVEVSDFQFTPDSVLVEVSDVVHWVWIEGSHTTTSGDNCTPNGLWNTPLGPSLRTFDYTFHSEGRYNYFCDPHCDMGMTGSVIVVAPSGLPQTASGANLSVLHGVPNPFRKGTDLMFQLVQAGPIRIAVFDAGGRQVALLADGMASAGTHSISWNGRTDGGLEVPGGAYYARAWTARGGATATLIKVD